MHKLVITLLVTLGMVFFSTILFAQPVLQSQEVSYGSTFEKSCSDDLCTATLYSYEKYFNRNGNWELIDENFYDCSSNGVTKFCTKDYYFNTTISSNGVTAYRHNQALSFQMPSILNQQLTISPQISGNTLTYSNVLPNVDLVYTNYPRKLKEEIVIKASLQNLPSQDFQIIFSKSGSADFAFEEPIICDSTSHCQVLSNSITSEQISITIPISFLSTAAYPVTIDPTLIANESTSWDGFVKFNGTVHTRSSTPKTLKVGTVSASEIDFSSMDWDLSELVYPINVFNATLQVYLEGAVGETAILNITHLEKNSSMYPDNSSGNLLFYQDIRNGSVYASNLVLNPNTWNNLTFNVNGTQAIESALAQHSFSFGIDGEISELISVAGKGSTTASRRPRLTLVYGATNSIANNAIEQGILSSLPVNPITSNQQIYMVNQQGQHFYGTFDKATTKNNQTWVFNYITSNESFVNMSSLFNVLNIWQNTTLNATQITHQVGLYINDTKLP